MSCLRGAERNRSEVMYGQVYEYEDSGRVSRVTAAFQSRASQPAEVQSVEAHMALDNVHKLKQMPKGEVRAVSLPDDVTRHFRDLKVDSCPLPFFVCVPASAIKKDEMSETKGVQLKIRLHCSLSCNCRGGMWRPERLGLLTDWTLLWWSHAYGLGPC